MLGGIWGEMQRTYIHSCVWVSSQGKKVKGLVLINPQNPLGDVYTQGSLQEYLVFAKKYVFHPV